MAEETQAGQQRSDLDRWMLYQACSICQGTGMMVMSKPDAVIEDAVIEARTACIACKKLSVVPSGLTVPQAERLAKLPAEVARLTAALHAARKHPDYNYFVFCTLTAADLPVMQASGWEPNPEYECVPGDECWRRRRDAP